MTKAEIALELTKLALDKGKIYGTESALKDVSVTVKDTYNMFIEELKIFDNGRAMPDSE